MPGWTLIAAPLLVAVIAGGFIALGMAFAPSRAARVLPLVRAGALIVAIVSGLIALTLAGYTLLSDPVRVVFPVTPLPVTLPDGVSDVGGASGALVAGTGGLDRISAEVTGLSMAARIPLALSLLCGSAVTVITALALARLAKSVTADTFDRGISRAFFASSIVVFVGGGLASLLEQFGSWQTSSEVLGIHSWSYFGPGSPDSLAELGWPSPAPFQLAFEFWPLLIAAGLGAVAIAFRSGERLATRAADAERELDGLI